MTRTVLANQPGMSMNTLTVNLPLRRIITVRRLAITELVFGGILALLEIIGWGIGIMKYDIMSMTGAGIWCGCVFGVSGILGILATRPPTTGVDRRGLFTGVLVMCILCSILAGGMVSFAIVSVIVATTGPGNWGHSYDSPQAATMVALMAIRIISILIYFALFILFIIDTVYASLNVCGSGPCTVSTDQVVYHTITTYAAPLQVQLYGPGPAIAGAPAYSQDRPPMYHAAIKDSDSTIKEKEVLIQS